MGKNTVFCTGVQKRTTFKTPRVFHFLTNFLQNLQEGSSQEYKKGVKSKFLIFFSDPFFIQNRAQMAVLCFCIFFINLKATFMQSLEEIVQNMKKALQL